MGAAVGVSNVDNTIYYLNTDLDLTSSVDLMPLAAKFESHNIHALHVTHCDNGLWIATFEMDNEVEPERNISAMVAAVESLDDPHRFLWQSCTRREFNIGYDCGAEPGPSISRYPSC
jgi:hypothetical protein